VNWPSRNPPPRSPKGGVALLKAGEKKHRAEQRLALAIQVVAMFIRGSGSGDSDAAELTFDCCVNLEEENIAMKKNKETGIPVACERVRIRAVPVAPRA